MRELNTKMKIIEELRKIIDPHIGENIYDLGLIPKIEVKEGVAYIEFKPTTPECPMTIYFEKEIEELVGSIEGIKKVKVKIVVE